MDQKFLYAFRGWIGFVAFMDFSTGIRCFIEKRVHFGQQSSTHAIPYESMGDVDDPTLPRILGYYSVLKALALVHCTLFIHYKPIVSMGACSLILSILMYGAEVSYYHSTTFNFYVAFPCILNVLTLIGLVVLPRRVWEPMAVEEEENVELLRQTALARRRKPRRDECST